MSDFISVWLSIDYKNIRFLMLNKWLFPSIRNRFWCCHLTFLTRWKTVSEEIRNGFWQYQKAYLIETRFFFVIFISISRSRLKAQDDGTLSSNLAVKHRFALGRQKSMFNEENAGLWPASSLKTTYNITFFRHLTKIMITILAFFPIIY